MKKPVVRLYDTVGTGVIIEHPTGVVYSNQAGGTSCLQPSIEGAFVPFGNDVLSEGREFVSPEDELRAYFEGPKHQGTGAIWGLDKKDADAIDAILKTARENRWLEVDRKRLKESCEAWVFVTIQGDEATDAASISEGFGPYPKPGVLTWCNSN